MEEVESLSVFTVPIFCLSLPEPLGSTAGIRAPQASGGGARGVTQQEGQSWEQGTCSTGLVDLASDTCDLPAGWPHVPHRAE